MRAHQAASAASSSREKCTRPLVVGPSPVMTPSRTMVSAWAADSRQDGSRAPIDSTPLVVEAVIVPLLGSWSGSAWPPGREWVVNDLKPALRVFEMSANWPHLFRLISNRFRFELRSRPAGWGLKCCDCTIKTFGQGRGAFYNHGDFFVAVTRLTKRCYAPPAKGNNLPFCGPTVHLRCSLSYTRFRRKFSCNLNDMRTSHGTADWRCGPGFRGRNHRGQDQVPRLDRKLLGAVVLASEGFHAGLHHGTRRTGEVEAGIRQARRQADGIERRCGRSPREMVRGYQGNAGRGTELSDDRRHRLQRLETLRHAARLDLRRPHHPHRRRQPDGP